MITGCLQIKNDKYYAMLNLKVDGKRKPKWIATGLPVRGNKRKAEAELARLINEYEELETIESNRTEADVAFVDYMQAWLKMIKPTIATATYQSYSNMVNNRIDRHFRALKVSLGDVSPQQIQNFYQLILDDGCKTNTVIHYHAILRRALQNAVKKEIILRNPADKIDRPKKNTYRAAFCSAEEMLTLFEAIQGDPLELCVKIAAYYGLRRSEVLGLQWDAINFKDKSISVRHKVIEVEQDGKSVLVGEDVLKTKSSFRTLPLLPVVEQLLLAEKEKQETYRKLFKKSYCTDYLEYICVDQTGKLLRPNYVTEHFRWLIDKYGFKKMRFHDLRHTCASLLLANGVPMKQIQLWLGHSTFSTTADIYAHLDYSAQQETGTVASAMFEKSSGAKPTELV